MEKINFINQSTPALNATNLNKLQDNVEDAIDEINVPSPETTYTESDTKTYSCNYVNDAVAGVVESGSNTNGNYVKFLDGTMVCYGSFTKQNVAIVNSWGNVYGADLTDPLTFPQTFYSAPIATVFNVAGNSFWVHRVQTSEEKITTLSISRPNSYTSTFTFGYVAIGRWK